MSHKRKTFCFSLNKHNQSLIFNQPKMELRQVPKKKRSAFNFRFLSHLMCFGWLLKVFLMAGKESFNGTWHFVSSFCHPSNITHISRFKMTLGIPQLSAHQSISIFYTSDSHLKCYFCDCFLLLSYNFFIKSRR